MYCLEVSAAVRHIYIYMSLGFKRLILANPTSDTRKPFYALGIIKVFNAKHARCDLFVSESIKTSLPKCPEMHNEVYFGSPHNFDST